MNNAAVKGTGAWATARHAIAKGWRVFPLKGKVPLTPRGFHDASSDPADLERWEAEHPSANVGVATGRASGILVLDIDGPEGEARLAELTAAHGPLPATFTVATARGRHLYARYPADRDIRIGAGLGGQPGLDWRGDGGYVVLPGSIHPSGAVYSVADRTPPADFPDWLLDLMTRRAPARPEPADPTPAPAPVNPDGATPYGRKALDDEAAKVRSAAEGTREDTLVRCAFRVGQLVGGNQIRREDAEAALLSAAAAAGLPPLEAEDKTRRALDAGSANPRTPPPRDPPDDWLPPPKDLTCPAPTPATPAAPTEESQQDAPAPVRDHPPGALVAHVAPGHPCHAHAAGERWTGEDGIDHWLSETGRWCRRAPGGGWHLVESVPLRKNAPRGDGKPVANDGEISQSPDDAAWEAPTPIAAGRRPPFPVDALPGWLASWVRAQAETTQTMPDLAGMLALTAVSACVARRFTIRTHPDHEEPLNIYTLTVLPSGNRKSSVVSDAADPIEEYERQLIRTQLPEIEAAKLERKGREARAAQLERDYSKVESEDEQKRIRGEMADLAAQIAFSDAPVLPRLLADDTTPERLAGLLAEQNGRMAILTAEGGIFETLAGRYAKTPGAGNIDCVLKAHSGENVRIDRQGRPPVFIRRASLVLGLAVQPDVLRGLARKEGFRGRGLCGRFLYSYPLSLLGVRRIQTRPIPAEIRRIYHDRLFSLLDLAPAKTEDGEEIPHVLTLSTEASAAFFEFAAELEPLLAEYGDLGHMTDWAGKLVGAAGRIAGLLHLATVCTRGAPQSVPVPVETMRAAIEIARYLLAHARLAYGDMGADEDLDDARYLLGWIRSKDIESFTCSAVHRSTRHGRFTSTEQIERAVRVLCAHGLVREQRTTDRKRGRPSKGTYEVNPALFSDPTLADPSASDAPLSDPAPTSVTVPDLPEPGSNG